MKHYLVLAVISSAIIIPAISTGTASATNYGDNRVICTPTNQVNIAAAQQVFSVELARLVAERNMAISAAQSLTGTMKTNALIAADTRFRVGVNNALNTLRLAKQMSGRVNCNRVEDRHDNRVEDRHDNRVEDRHDNRMEDRRDNDNQRGRDNGIEDRHDNRMEDRRDNDDQRG